MNKNVLIVLSVVDALLAGWLVVVVASTNLSDDNNATTTTTQQAVPTPSLPATVNENAVSAGDGVNVSTTLEIQPEDNVEVDLEVTPE